VLLHEDIRVRTFINAVCTTPESRSRDRTRRDKAKVKHPHARPGIVIGKKGAEIDKLKTSSTSSPAAIASSTPRSARPDIDAQLVAENVALQLERRVAFGVR